MLSSGAHVSILEGMTEDVEALAALIVADTDEPMWSAVVIAKHILGSDLLAARDARLLAEVERERDEAREQGNKLADGLHVWRDQCEAAEAETARLRHDIEALREQWSACWCTVDGGGNQVQQRDCPQHGSDDCRHMAEGIATHLTRVLAAERDPEAGEGRG